MNRIIATLIALIFFSLGLSVQYFPTEPNMEILSFLHFFSLIASIIVLPLALTILTLSICKKIPKTSMINLIPFILIGAIIAYPLSWQVNRFQYNELNKAGNTIENELDKFSNAFGHYPHSLTDLSGLDQKLIWPYSNLQNFRYVNIEDQKVKNNFLLSISLANCRHDWISEQRKWIAEDPDYR